MYFSKEVNLRHCYSCKYSILGVLYYNIGAVCLFSYLTSEFDKEMNQAVMAQ